VEWNGKNPIRDTRGMRPCDVFLQERGELLGQHGYRPDSSLVERITSDFMFYHYTRPDRLEHIFAPGSGLFARRPVACPTPPPEFVDGYLVEGFLEPLPIWLTQSPYFGDLGFALLRDYIGDILLRIEVPHTFPGLYVADYAHLLECKHLTRRGRSPLGLGYTCVTGHESTQAYVHSYIPAHAYTGGHIAPVAQFVRKGPGIAVPAQYIQIADQQPLIAAPR
jgi:hypothetical protein